MLDDLKTNLGAAIKKIIRSSSVDKELIDALVNDIQKALILGDVEVQLVKNISDNIKERTKNEKLPPGLSRKDHIVKILYEELSRLLGKDHKFEFHAGTNKVLMLGIQGSGKTTMTSKLAKFLTRQGYKVGVIGADTFRPGALVQLRTMCKKSQIEVYGEKNTEDAARVVRNGLHHFGRAGLDIILIDTAGRHKEEHDLLDEMKRIDDAASGADLALLVIDGTIGHQCANQAKAFHEIVPVGGIAITKLDSSAKGGGAIAASSATGAQVMYIGTGERIDDIEEFSPTRFVGRILGMGDIKAILDIAKRLEAEGDEKRMKRIASGKMSIEDFYAQIEQMGSMSALRGILENVSNLGGAVSNNQIEQLEEKVEKWRYIIQSMNKKEKDEPGIINSSRTRRIAHGSGLPEHAVKDLLKGYKNAKAALKMSKGREMRGMLKRFGIG